MKKKSFIITIVLFLIAPLCFSQQMDDNYYDETSIHPVRNADIMYKRTIWKLVDLRQKFNESLFAQGNEITRIIIDAIKAGVLRPFKNDSMTTRMRYEDFLENLKIPGEDTDLKADFGGEGAGDEWGTEGDEWGTEGDGGGGNQAEEFFPTQMYLLEVKADYIIDEKKSLRLYDIKTIKIIIPSEYNPTGLNKDVAVCSFKELVENVFLNNKYAVWFNTKNLQENRNLIEAFYLALYNGLIVKYSNPKNLMIEDIYQGNQRMSLLKSIQFDHSLVEYESNLWSN